MLDFRGFSYRHYILSFFSSYLHSIIYSNTANWQKIKALGQTIKLSNSLNSITGFHPYNYGEGANSSPKLVTICATCLPQTITNIAFAAIHKYLARKTGRRAQVKNIATGEVKYLNKPTTMYQLFQ